MFRFNILNILPTKEHVLLNGITRTAWFRSRVQLMMQAQKKRGGQTPIPTDMSVEFAQKALYTTPIPACVCRWLSIVGEGA